MYSKEASKINKKMTRRGESSSPFENQPMYSKEEIPPPRHSKIIKYN
jgi:hypothetical protein